MQSNPKGTSLPFATASTGILALSANYQRLMEHRLQYAKIFAVFLGFCRRLLMSFCLLQKGMTP
jgi:hypothetical protein